MSDSESCVHMNPKRCKQTHVFVYMCIICILNKTSVTALIANAVLFILINIVANVLFNLFIYLFTSFSPDLAHWEPAHLICVCVCVCARMRVFVTYEDTNLFNDMGMT